ncbi:MAG: LysM peptidoglycan-binding domain-containing protein [Anaerolineaceae bacterium]|nr:LysM peptidoglycan-binding domain-containing protein [Anaerolineaceae bacterium]
MAELDLTNAFNDCVDRLAQGQSIDDCLRRYPQFESSLRPMLEAGLLVRRIHTQPEEVLAAQAHVRRRFEDALRAPAPKRQTNFSRLIYALAAILIIAFISVGSLTAVSQNSLPGDPLYSAKRFSESLQQSILNSDDLESSFNQRRVQEIQQLLALGRTELVTFKGVITNKNGTNWTVGSLLVYVESTISDAAFAHIGDEVIVMGHTTESRTVVATAIQILKPASTPVPTALIPTQTLDITATPTPGPSLTISTTQHVATETIIPTTRTPVPTLTVRPLPTVLTPTVCAPVQPNGWVSYQIRSGDTLSGLASTTSITMAELMLVNCITDASRIFVGETIYLPRIPAVLPSAAATATTNQSSGNNSSSSNNSNQDSPKPTDDHGEDNHSGSGNSGSGSGSGSDSGSSHDDDPDHG